MNFPGLDPAWSFGHHAGHALGLVRTWSLPRTRTAVEDGEKVLVVATTALGDSILTTPLIETLSEKLGRDRVSLLVKAPYAELYRGDPRLHALFTVRGKYRWRGLREKLVADPHRIALIANMTEPDLVPFLWRCGVRGFLRYRTRWTRYPRWMANCSMLRRPEAPDYATGHAIENNLAMAAALGIEPTTHLLSLPHLKAATGRGRTGHPHPPRRLARDQAVAGRKLGPPRRRPRREILLPHRPDRRPSRRLPRDADRLRHADARRKPGRQTLAARAGPGRIARPRFSFRRHRPLPSRGRGRLPHRDPLRADRSRLLRRGMRAAPDRRDFPSLAANGPLGDSIRTIPVEKVLAEATAVVEASLAPAQPRVSGMKIAIFLPNATFDLPGSPEVGGIETFSFTVGEALQRLGHEVVLFGGEPKPGHTHRPTTLTLELHPYWERDRSPTSAPVSSGSCSGSTSPGVPAAPGRSAVATSF